MNSATGNNKEYEDLRVVILDGNNRKLDVSDKLEKSDNFRRPLGDKSKMCLTICDYTNKDKGGSVTAKFNFTPKEIAEFDFIMRINGDFMRSYDRIFNSPDEDGLSPVKKIMISRQAKMQDGTISRYPVYIRIENGRAKCNVNKKGMTSFSSNTFISDQIADIRLSYEDARTLFRESAEYIERMKIMYALEIKGSSANNSVNTKVGAGLSETKYVEGVNCLYKAIEEQFQRQKDFLVSELTTVEKEIEELRNEVMFGK